jgi:hypothetical protein
MDFSVLQIALVFAWVFIIAIDQFDFLESLYQPIVSGAVIGAILGAIIILATSWEKALIFLVLFFILPLILLLILLLILSVLPVLILLILVVVLDSTEADAAIEIGILGCGNRVEGIDNVLRCGCLDSLCCDSLLRGRSEDHGGDDHEKCQDER